MSLEKIGGNVLLCLKTGMQFAALLRHYEALVKPEQVREVG